MARELADLATPSRRANTEPGSLQEGTVSKAPATLDDPLYVVIPAYSRDYEFGPCVWMPRGTNLPVVGTTCYVAFSGKARKPVVVAWEGETTF